MIWLTHVDHGDILVDSKSIGWAYFSKKNKAVHIILKTDGTIVVPVTQSLQEIEKLIKEAQ